MEGFDLRFDVNAFSAMRAIEIGEYPLVCFSDLLELWVGDLL